MAIIVTPEGDLEVDHVDLLGSDTTFNVALPNGGKLIVRCSPTLAICDGGKVSVTAPADVLRVLTRQAGDA